MIMLANFFQNSTSTGVPNFTYSVKLDNIYESSLLGAIPDFIHGLNTYSRTKSLSEEDFSQEYLIALNRYFSNNPKGILAVPEYRDIYTQGANPVKRVDIAFVSLEQGASKSKLYTVEAKRLPTGKGKREQEYIYGFSTSDSPSGGIQRFKTGDHGYGLPESALLSYVEENDFIYWHKTINSWIANKANELPLDWKEDERLKDLYIDPTEICSTCHSVAYRESDAIELFHLWIKIPKNKS